MKKQTSFCHSSSRRETITTATTSPSPSPPLRPPQASRTTTTTTTSTSTMDDKLLAPITVDNPNSSGYIIDLHSAPTQAQQHQLSNNHKNKKLFPKKLWDLINDERYNFCLRWSDDGHLVYLNRDDFEDSYLRTPENQFHTQKAISFVRQMNMYGFRKVDDCYYENDNFKRGCEHLLKNMIRKHPNKNQINNNSALSNNELSPNFYRSLSESPNGNEDGNFNPIQYFNGQPFLNHQPSLNNNCFDLSLRPVPMLNENSCDDFINNAQSQLINQQYQPSHYADPKELIKALVSQSPDALIPRDLSNKSLPSTQPDSNNFNAFYALLSTLNETLYQPQAAVPIPSPKRDPKLNRSFKRSADSILDSNNNPNTNNGDCLPDPIKRIRLEKPMRHHRDQVSTKQLSYNYAKNLVTQVALARDAQLDTNVISEASKYTERFVEILFDTVQVIARHSNGSNSASDSMNDNYTSAEESKNDKDGEKLSINLNDLTSALKLLPSKLSTILK